MKDIDFDELDRAVHSVIGGGEGSKAAPATGDHNEFSVPVTVTPAPDDVTAPPSEPDSLAETNADTESSISAHALHSRLMPGRPAQTPPDVAAQDTPSEEPSPQVAAASEPEESEPVASGVPGTGPQPQGRSLALRRGGRFMDVVHPSSDMRSRTSTSASTSRQGIAIAPVEQRSEPDATSLAEDAADPVASPVHDIPPVSATNDSLEDAINQLLISEGHEPVAADQDKTQTPPQDTVIEEAITPPPLAIQDSLSSVISGDMPSLATDVTPEPQETVKTAQTSPFLVDAKVSKRPLGNAPADIAQEPEIVSDPQGDANDVNHPLAAPVETPLPEELQDDLVAVESADNKPGSIVQAAPAATQQPSADKDTKSEDSAYAGPTSIARQYREEPRSEGEAVSGAIFDTESYHQPIEHPAKKSSGWGWVIVIVVILFLATIGGVVAWMGGFLNIPM